MKLRRRHIVKVLHGVRDRPSTFGHFIYYACGVVFSWETSHIWFLGTLLLAETTEVYHVIAEHLRTPD